MRPRSAVKENIVLLELPRKPPVQQVSFVQQESLREWHVLLVTPARLKRVRPLYARLASIVLLQIHRRYLVQRESSVQLEWQRVCYVGLGTTVR